MAFHIVENADGSTTFTEVAQGDSTGEVRVVFADGRDVTFGAGQTDTDLTYIKVKEATAGADAYIIVTGTTVSASASRP